MTQPVGIVIVDDEPDFASGVARLLEREFPDERIATACSGDEALEVLGHDAFGLMLSIWEVWYE